MDDFEKGGKNPAPGPKIDPEVIELEAVEIETPAPSREDIPEPGDFARPPRPGRPAFGGAGRPFVFSSNPNGCCNCCLFTLFAVIAAIYMLF